MVCNFCNSKTANSMHFRENGTGCCNECGSFKQPGLPDVFFNRPYMDQHLIDTNDRRQKDGVWINSRQQKAEIMRKLNVHESGDRVRGARN